MTSAADVGAVTAWEIAASVPDPELPMVTVAELGILRDVAESDGRVVVTITPTYSGCPAMREISCDLARRLRAAGWHDVEMRTSLSPAWSSDWITPAGRAKLQDAGIAPPGPAPRRSGPVPLTLTTRRTVGCPRCGAETADTTAIFGSTACKSLHRCTACGEPFESVKAI